MFKAGFRPVKRAVFNAVALTLALASARAQTSAALSDAAPLPDIVVTATGDATPISQIGSSVTVITADQIEAQQRRTVSEALEAAPGLNVVQSGGPGGATSIFMRGANSNQVKVLIDGVDVSDPSNPTGAFDFGQLLTGDIERIEVLRGPQSGLYGSDAIGGVISITTKKGSGPPKVAASVEGGSFGTLNEKFGLSGASSIFNYSFNVDHVRSVDTPVVPAYLKPPTKKAADNFYDNYTYSARVGADLTDTFAVNSILRFTKSMLLFNSDQKNGGFADPDRSQQTDRQFYTREEAVWHSLDNRFRTTFGAAYTDVSTYTVQPPEDFTPPSTYIGGRLKFDLKQEIGVVEGEKLILGAEWERDSLNNETTTYANDNRALYGELESNPFNNFFVASNIRYDDNESFGGHYTYRIAPAYFIPDVETKLKASFGTGFKAPTLNELYQNYPAYGYFANPHLRPEESSGYDIGFEQPFLNERIRVGSTYFHNNITNLITDNATFTTDVNVGKAVTYGDESFVSYKVNEQLDFRADYTYTIARNLITNTELARRPKNKATLQANWTPMDKLHLSGTLLYVGAWSDINPLTYATQRASGYATVNVAASYDINAQTSVFARVDNLFNRQYEDPLGYRHPGLGAYAGVRVSSF